MLERVDLEAEIAERQDTPYAWGVEAIDYNKDGSVMLAVFSGPEARARAVEYARAKYRKITLD